MGGGGGGVAGGGGGGGVGLFVATSLAEVLTYFLRLFSS